MLKRHSMNINSGEATHTHIVLLKNMSYEKSANQSTEAMASLQNSVLNSHHLNGVFVGKKCIELNNNIWIYMYIDLLCRQLMLIFPLKTASECCNFVAGIIHFLDIQHQTERSQTAGMFY